MKNKTADTLRKEIQHIHLLLIIIITILFSVGGAAINVNAHDKAFDRMQIFFPWRKRSIAIVASVFGLFISPGIARYLPLAADGQHPFPVQRPGQMIAARPTGGSLPVGDKNDRRAQQQRNQAG